MSKLKSKVTRHLQKRIADSPELSMEIAKNGEITKIFSLETKRRKILINFITNKQVHFECYDEHHSKKITSFVSFEEFNFGYDVFSSMHLFDFMHAWLSKKKDIGVNLIQGYIVWNRTTGSEPENHDCPACHGTGKCPGCDGDGKVGIFEKLRTCPECTHDAGKCKFCDGSGRKKTDPTT